MHLALVPTAMSAVHERTPLSLVEIVADRSLLKVDDVLQAVQSQDLLAEVVREPGTGASAADEKNLDKHLVSCARQRDEGEKLCDLHRA